MKKNFLNLGRQPLANSFLVSNSKKTLSKEFFYNLNISFDTSSYLVSVANPVNPKYQYTDKYAHIASESITMRKAFAKIAKKLNQKYSPKIIMEIGSNDGVFIKNFKKYKVIAIEPCKNLADLTKKKYKTYPNFWNKKLANKIFLKSWQCIGDSDLVKDKSSIYPTVILENYLNEPIVLTKDEKGAIHCLTNVCTHRGNILVFEPGKSKKITCMYHGRRFNNKGEFEFMPEFDKAKNFPRPCDNLHKFPLVKWGKLLFAGLNPTFDFQKVIDRMNERIGFLPIDKFEPDNSLSKDFTINAHWALYCDNYL